MEFDAIQKMIDWIKDDIEKDSLSFIKSEELKEILIHEKSRYLQKAIFLNRYSNYKSMTDTIVKTKSIEIDGRTVSVDKECLPNIYKLLKGIDYYTICEGLELRLNRSNLDKHIIDDILFSILQKFYEEVFKQIEK